MALVVLVVAWSGLYADIGWPHLAALAVVAALPAVAATSRRARGALVAVAVVAGVPIVLGMALRHSAWDYVTADATAWGDARAVLPDSLRTASDTGLPVSWDEHPELVALLDLALAGLAATAAWQILARRRPVAGLVALGVGLAYRWTVEPPASEVLAGALALAAVAAVLALSSWEGGGEGAARRAGGALALGGVAVLLGAGLGAGPVQTGEPWWSWKDWEVGGGESTAGSALDLRQRYGVLDWPDTPRVALTVASEVNLPLRAVVFEDFDGESFVLADPTVASTRERLVPVLGNAIALYPGAGSEGGRQVSQRVTLVGASTQVLLASGRPRRIEGPFSGSARLAAGAIQLERTLEPGDSYTVRTVLPRPRPADLVGAGPYAAVPESSTRLRGAYGGGPVDVPAWGSGDAQPDDEALGAYAPVRDLARQVVGDARSPYAAVNRIESHLRRRYVYDEQPPYPTGLPAGDVGLPDAASRVDRPPLVDFLLSSRRGFCQHFAGAMAVMLRSVGIPARVAVGYGTGRYDTERSAWVVLDRDAHSWVEVWFPGRGWLPFDPTPGRSAPNPASVSSPEYAPSAFDIDLGGLEGAAVEPPPEEPGPAEEPAEEQEEQPATAAPDEGGGPPWQWALLVLVVPLAAVPSARAARRARARRRGDERARVVAAARDLEASLHALGWAPPPAGSPSERAADVRDRTGVDPTPLYRRAARARYAPEPLPPGAGAAAWREAGRLRRAIARRASLGRRLRAAFGVPLRRRGTVVT